VPTGRDPSQLSIPSTDRSADRDSAAVSGPVPVPGYSPVPQPTHDTADWRDAVLQNERQAWHSRTIQTPDGVHTQRHVDSPEVGGLPAKDPNG